MAYGRKVEKNRFGYMVGSFVILLGIVYLGFNMMDGWRKYRESTRRLEASTASILELTRQNEELQKAKELEYSSTGYERQVRSKFDLARPDENVVFIINEEQEVPLKEEKGFKKMFHNVREFFGGEE